MPVQIGIRLHTAFFHKDIFHTERMVRNVFQRLFNREFLGLCHFLTFSTFRRWRHGGRNLQLEGRENRSAALHGVTGILFPKRVYFSVARGTIIRLFTNGLSNADRERETIWSALTSRISASAPSATVSVLAWLPKVVVLSWPLVVLRAASVFACRRKASVWNRP